MKKTNEIVNQIEQFFGVTLSTSQRLVVEDVIKTFEKEEVERKANE